MGPKWKCIDRHHDDLLLEAVDGTHVSFLSGESDPAKLRGVVSDVLFLDIHIPTTVFTDILLPIKYAQKMEFVFFRVLGRMENVLYTLLAATGRVMHVSDMKTGTTRETKRRSAGFRSSVYAALWAMQKVGIPYVPARLVVDHLKRTRGEICWNHRRKKRRRRREII